MNKVSLFLFTQDLRLHDNTALIKATTESNQVIPCFFFSESPDNFQKHQPFCFQFLLESLQWLTSKIKNNNGALSVLSGDLLSQLKAIKNEINFTAIYLNRYYSPQLPKLMNILELLQVPINISQDYLLHKPELILTKTKNPYKVFTPFFKYSQALPIRSPEVIPKTKFKIKRIESIPKFKIEKWMDSDLVKSPHFQGGRVHALKILENLKNFKNYQIDRDIPSIEGTTSLSAHLNLGTCSIRETYNAVVNQLGISHPLVRQLFWRDFYIYIAVHYPHVFEGSFRRKYDTLQWGNDENQFQKWKNGITGFPIVDAGMRQLNQTGFMHNRVRMLVGSFLTKDLHIDWRWGEQYFREKLADFDPMINNGNWQWVAGTGCDAAPYFRIFNPWTQQKKYDPNCLYIKRWVPELQNVPTAKIHKIYIKPLSDSINYPKPIVEHAKARIDTLEMYKTV